MKILKIVLGVVLAGLVIVALIAPIGPVPGFFMGGDETAAPSTWPDTSEVHEIQLRVGGGLPRVVIIWVIEHADELYVVGSPDSGWVQKIGTGAPVDMLLEGKRYALNAVVVNDGFAPILQAYVAKYEPDYPEIVAGFPSAEEAGNWAAVFRLDRGA